MKKLIILVTGILFVVLIPSCSKDTTIFNQNGDICSTRKIPPVVATVETGLILVDTIAKVNYVELTTLGNQKLYAVINNQTPAKGQNVKIHYEYLEPISNYYKWENKLYNEHVIDCKPALIFMRHVEN